MPKASSFAAWESPLQLEKKRDEFGGISLAEVAAIDFEDLGRFKQAWRSPKRLQQSAPRYRFGSFPTRGGVGAAG